MIAQTTKITPNPADQPASQANSANQGALPVATCTECDARIPANVALPGEILDCPDCGAELEVRSVSPLVLALAPAVEEDWGE